MQFVNGRLRDGKLYSFSILGGRFASLTQQEALVTPVGVDQDLNGHWVLPPMVDIHVHSRSPGHPHKETWTSLGQAALRGGVGLVCDMPNTQPPTIDAASLVAKASLARTAAVPAQFYIGVCAENLRLLPDLLADYGNLICGFKIYYGKTTGTLLFDDLEQLARALPRPFPGILAFHSEDQCAIDRNRAQREPLGKLPEPAAFGVHSAIRSAAAAMTSTAAILDWGQRHKIPLHIAHLSTPQEMELITAARSRGTQVTCEVAPHHLIFSTADYSRLGGFIKMNPPVRSQQERDALCRYFADGSIDVFATDHAPHTIAEKRNTSYDACPSGVPGVELFAPLLLTLAKNHGLSFEAAVAMGVDNPLRLLGLPPEFGQIAPGLAANFVVIREATYQLATSIHGGTALCGWTPYDGLELHYRVESTWLNGEQLFALGQNP